MLGMFLYTDQYGEVKRMTFSEVYFKNRYCYFIDNVTDSQFVIGIKKGNLQGRLFESLKQEIYFLVTQALHNNTPFSLDRIISSFGNNLVYKEIELKKEKPLKGNLRNITRDLKQQSTQFKTYLFDMSLGFLGVQSTVKDKRIIFETPSKIVYLELFDLEGNAFYDEGVTNFLWSYITSLSFSTNLAILKAEDIVTILYNNGVSLQVRFTGQSVKPI